MNPRDINKHLIRLANSIDANPLPSKSNINIELKKVVLALNEHTIEKSSSDEGDMTCPTAQMVAHLSKWLSAKYTIENTYRSFSDRVRGPWRDSLVDHWYEHSKEERAHAYDLSMKIVGLGGDPALQMLQIPQCPPNLEGFFRTLMALELEAIRTGRKAIQLGGERTSIKVMAENMILVDTQHLDDLRRMSVAFELPI